MKFITRFFAKRSIDRKLSIVKQLPADDEKPFEPSLLCARQTYSACNQKHTGLIHSEWIENLNNLENYFLKEMDEEFLSHPIINGTMVFSDAIICNEEMSELVRWYGPEFIKIVAHRLPSYLRNKESVTNSIHHLFHIAQFEQWAKIKLDSVNSFIEFGGGYGNMWRLVQKLAANSNNYKILDLPLIASIQNAYINCLQDSEEVKNAIELVPIYGEKELHGHQTDFFLSTWALSESPKIVFDAVVRENWYGSKYLLLAFHEKWKPWAPSELDAILKTQGWEYHIKPMETLRGSSYLFGIRAV
jgi:hypothetical protein